MKAKYISTPERANMMIAIIWVSAISLSFVIFSFVSGVSIGSNERVCLYLTLKLNISIKLLCDLYIGYSDEF